MFNLQKYVNSDQLVQFESDCWGKTKFGVSTLFLVSCFYCMYSSWIEIPFVTPANNDTELCLKTVTYWLEPNVWKNGLLDLYQCKKYIRWQNASFQKHSYVNILVWLHPKVEYSINSRRPTFIYSLYLFMPTQYHIESLNVYILKESIL